MFHQSVSPMCCKQTFILTMYRIFILSSLRSPKVIHLLIFGIVFNYSKLFAKNWQKKKTVLVADFYFDSACDFYFHIDEISWAVYLLIFFILTSAKNIYIKKYIIFGQCVVRGLLF